MADPAVTSTNLYNTTLQRWLKGYDDQTTEIHPLFAMLEAKGRIKYNGSGKFLQRTQRNKQHSLEGYSDYEVIQFARQELFENAKLPWRGLLMTGAISEKESDENSGPEAKVRYCAEKLEIMKEDADDQLGAIFYGDGNLAANSKKPHGIMSFMGYTQGSQNATDAFATVPTDSYAELSTALGAYGGTGTNSGATFRRDDDSPEWNAFTPILVNATYNDGGGATTFAASADKLIGRADVHANHSGKAKDSLDFFAMRKASMLVLRDLLRTKERIVAERGEAQSAIKAAGFTGAIAVDGVDCVIDAHVPATDGSGRTLHAIGWNCDRVSLTVLKNGNPNKTNKGLKFWQHSGVWEDPNQAVFKYWLRNYCNLMFQPRYFAMISSLG